MYYEETCRNHHNDKEKKNKPNYSASEMVATISHTVQGQSPHHLKITRNGINDNKDKILEL